MEIKKEDVGALYLKELAAVVAIRKDRYKIYVDSFMNDKPSDLLVHIRGKLNRYNTMKEFGTEFNNYENSLSNLYDAVNYLLFLCVLERKDFEKRKAEMIKANPQYKDFVDVEDDGDTTSN